ncbi:MAG: MoaD/ThiS family protein [Fimbriimonadaceae bacterium]
MSRTIRIEFCASLRDQAGTATATIESTAATCGDLYCELRERYGFVLPTNLVKFGIGNAICGAETALEGVEAVVLIPPVCGG